MYKNRVENNRKKKFQIPALLSCEWENLKLHWENSKYIGTYVILNFPAPFFAGFPRSQDKRAGISKKILSFLYSIFIVV